MIEDIREAAGTDIVDYQQLVNMLKEYKKPRDKITKLVNSGALIRLKNGLYIFGKLYRRDPLCLPWIANRLFGPSYVSLQFALAHYGLIPEKVVEVTSISTGRKKRFETKVGRFSYFQMNGENFSTGVVIEKYAHLSYFIANPTKALADLIQRTKNLKTPTDIARFFEEDLRLDLPEDFTIDQEVIDSYSTKAVQLIPKALKLL